MSLKTTSYMIAAVSALAILPLSFLSTEASAQSYGKKPGKVFSEYGYNTVGTKHGDVFLRPMIGGRPPVTLRADPPGKAGGNDLILMANQALKIYGGPGADRFVVHPYASFVHEHRHIIMDFNAAKGDKIDLSFLKGEARDWPGLTFIGSAEFEPGVAGQVRFEPGLLEISVSTWDAQDGDERLIQIRMKEVYSLSEGSLVFDPDAKVHRRLNKLMEKAKKKMKKKGS